MTPWESEHPSFLSQSSSSSNCDLGKCPRLGNLDSPSSQLPCSGGGMEGWRTGTGPRGLRMLGLHHVPGSRSSSALEAVRPIFPQAPPLACLGTSLFPGSAGRVPADRPGAPRWLPPLLARDPAILLPFAEKPPIYRSFSPRSFLLRRTPDFPAPKRSPTLARFQDPLLPSGDLPFTLFPSRGPSVHTRPSFLRLARIPTRLPLAEEPRLQARGRGVGWGEPPPLPPSGSGDPSHLRGERCVY